MRLMNWSLVVAAVQLCAWSAMATLLLGCGGPSPMTDDANVDNNVPSVSSLIATPSVISLGGRSDITGRVTDPDGDGVSWTLSLESSSTAAGTLVPFSAPSRDIASSFTPSRAGVAIIRALPHDGRNFGNALTVTVTVREGT